jgi:hypothetical protein
MNLKKRKELQVAKIFRLLISDMNVEECDATEA